MNINIDLLTTDQAAEALQVHVSAIYGYLKQGKLPVVRNDRPKDILPLDQQQSIESEMVKYSDFQPN